MYSFRDYIAAFYEYEKNYCMARELCETDEFKEVSKGEFNIYINNMPLSITAGVQLKRKDNIEFYYIFDRRSKKIFGYTESSDSYNKYFIRVGDCYDKA